MTESKRSELEKAFEVFGDTPLLEPFPSSERSIRKETINREILRKESQPDYRICSHSYKAWDTRSDELVLIHRKTLDITDLVEERDERAWERFGKAGIIKVEPC